MGNLNKTFIKLIVKTIVRIILVFFLFLLSAIIGTITFSKYYKSEIATKEEQKKMVDAIRLFGDTAAYNWFVDSCRRDSSSRFSRYLPYSFIMADKYNYLPAYYDVYKGLIDLYKPEYNLGEPDSLTREMALLFLIKGAEKGDSGAIKEIHLLIMKQ